jgi:Uma2 family endonuclease
MTTDELLALPDDGVERWLIRGLLREDPKPARIRWHTLRHGLVMARLASLIEDWCIRQPEPRGKVLCGGAGCRLRRDPDTTIGIDVVFVSAEVAARKGDAASLVDGVPVLAVDILEPDDSLELIQERIDTYLNAGVALLWLIDPQDRSLRIYRPGKAPSLLNTSDELSGESHLSGFRVALAELFAWPPV